MGDVVSNYTGPDAPDGNAIEAGGSSLTEIAGSVKGDITIKDSAMVVVHDGSSDNNTPRQNLPAPNTFSRWTKVLLLPLNLRMNS